jgi:hypothetical protein
MRTGVRRCLQVLLVGTLCGVTSPAYAVTIEPDFTVDPTGVPLDLCKVFKICKPGDKDTFTVEPAGFSSIHNDLKVAIKDIVMKILEPADAKWADVNGDGKVGTPAGGIFTKSTVSPDGKTITLEGGLIPPSTSFKPLFKTDPKADADVKVEGQISVVPEPTTLLLFGSTAAGIGLARWRQRRRKEQP